MIAPSSRFELLLPGKVDWISWSSWNGGFLHCWPWVHDGFNVYFFARERVLHVVMDAGHRSDKALKPNPMHRTLPLVCVPEPTVKSLTARFLAIRAIVNAAPRSMSH